MRDDVILARCLKVLGHPDRLRLIRLMQCPELFPGNLVDSATVGICVNDLAKAAGLAQSTASHHLGLMQDVGLLIVTEHGPWRYIRQDNQVFGQLATQLAALGNLARIEQSG